MTIYWWAVVAISRLRCRVLRRHAWMFWDQRGYSIAWCSRCYASTIERVAS